MTPPEGEGEALEVEAVWRGGYATDVRARGHAVRVDEPAHAGGEDTGMMPTELLCASLASCFCLALGHVAGKLGVELGDLRVHVRAERAGAALRYGRIVVTASAALGADELEPLVARAERYCWVSNTFATPPTIVYRANPHPSPTEVP